MHKLKKATLGINHRWRFSQHSLSTKLAEKLTRSELENCASSTCKLVFGRRLCLGLMLKLPNLRLLSLSVFFVVVLKICCCYGAAAASDVAIATGVFAATSVAMIVVVVVFVVVLVVVVVVMRTHVFCDLLLFRL